MWNKIKNIFFEKTQTLEYESGNSLEISEGDLERIRRMVYQTSNHEASVADEHLLTVIRAFTEVCFIDVPKYSIKHSIYDSFIRKERKFREGKETFILKDL